MARMLTLSKSRRMPRNQDGSKHHLTIPQLRYNSDMIYNHIAVCRGGNPDGQGPHIHLIAEITEGRIVNPTFKTYSCPAAFLSSQALCDLVEDKLLADLAGITEQDLIGCIGHDLPRSKRHCIHIAMEALANFTASAVKRSCEIQI